MVAERRKVHHIFKYGGRCQVGQFIVSNHTTFIFQYFEFLSYIRLRVANLIQDSFKHYLIFGVERTLDSVALRAFFGLHWNYYHCQVEQLSLFADRCRLNKENWSKFSKLCRTMSIHHKQASNPYSLTLEKSFWMWTFIPHWLMKTLIYADKHIIISYIQSHKSRITKYLHYD